MPTITAPAETVIIANCIRSVTASAHMPAIVVYNITATPTIIIVSQIGNPEIRYSTSPAANISAQQYRIEAIGTMLDSTPEALL